MKRIRPVKPIGVVTNYIRIVIEDLKQNKNNPGIREVLLKIKKAIDGVGREYAYEDFKKFCKEEGIKILPKKVNEGINTNENTQSKMRV